MTKNSRFLKNLVPLLLAATILLAPASGCFSPKSDITAAQLSPIVQRDLLVFDENSPNEKLIEILAPYKVVIVGEIHQITDSVRVAGEIAVALQPNGLRQVLLECPQAFGWMLENYAQGGDNYLPDFATTSYGELLEVVRDVNDSLPDENRIHVGAIDINHGYGDLAYSLKRFRYLLKDPSAVDNFITEIDSGKTYDKCLDALKDTLAENADLSGGQLGEDYSETLLEMIDIDAKSISMRGGAASSGKKAGEREAIMKDLTDRSLSKSEGSSLIYTGYYHAQKKTYFGTEKEFLGHYLHTKSPYAAGNCYSMVIVAARGQRPIGGDIRDFDVKDSQENDLFRVMNEVAGDRISFMPLTDNLFSTEKIMLNYFATKVAIPPASQFDGFIMLPEVSYVPMP